MNIENREARLDYLKVWIILPGPASVQKIIEELHHRGVGFPVVKPAKKLVRDLYSKYVFGFNI